MSHTHPDLPVGGADHDRILEEIGVAVLTIDAGGRLLEVNEAAVAMFGHPAAAMLGQNVRMLMPQHHADAHDSYLQRYFITGERRIIGGGRRLRGKRADGTGFAMHLAVGRFDVGGAAHDGAVRRLLELAPGLRSVHIDASLAQNALINLAINARDAMNGSGDLSIVTGNRLLDAQQARGLDLAPGEYVTLVVADSGTGIEPENLPRVFEPFYTTRPEGGGHGLGLSTVFGFVRQSGGQVTVESRPGEGARFTLLLPRADVPAVPAAIDGAAPQSPGMQRRHLILVVEDDDRVRRLNVRRLRHLGHDTLSASNGQAALLRFETHPDIDLLFNGMAMPGELSGLALARGLRAYRPELPVLIASGYSNELLGIDTLRDEGIRLLKKPYDAEALADLLGELLDIEPDAARAGGDDPD